jgi:hypothetical protein
MSLSIPLSRPSSTSSSSSSSWEALVVVLTSRGIVRNHFEPTRTWPCETLADVMMVESDDDGGETGMEKIVMENTNNENAAAMVADPPPPLLLVLVGGSWCAPCRNFTPVLASCFGGSGGSGGGSTTRPQLTNVKVLFCSADHDNDSFATYFQKMPSSWSAVPFDEDGEDERDDLLEALHANNLPCLLVFDPIMGTLLEKNAVHDVQACGPNGFVTLIDQWRARVMSGESNAVLITASERVNTGNAEDEKKEEDQLDHDDNNNNNHTLKYFIPTTPTLICQYFKERLLSPNLPEALTAVILRREKIHPNDDDDDDDDDEENYQTAMAMANTMVGPPRDEEKERWLFRTTAPALPMNWYGSTLLGTLVEANALECWQIERDTHNNNNTIGKATCTIENETGRRMLIFRETIVMEATNTTTTTTTTTQDGTHVTKTLNLDGVPTLAHGPFQRRWKKESDLIFHALLGTCDRKNYTHKRK